jgi:uncharacterized protein (TIGR03067 family)
MKWLVLLPLFCLVFPLVSGGNDGKDENDPAAAIQGEWIAVLLGSCGYELRGTAERPLTVIFDKDRIVYRPGVSITRTAEVSFVGGFKTEKTIEFSISERDLEGTFRLDASKTPSWIDVKQKGKVGGAKGIYRLKGNELEICMDRNAKRPDEFKNSDSTWLFRLKRTEKKD